MVIYQNFIIETPGWNPDSQGAVGGNDLVADRKIIRISCLASDEILVIKLDIAISVKVTVIGCLVGRIRVFSNRSNQSGNVGRAAGTGVPGREQWFVMQVSCNDTGDPRKHFQGIHVEKAFAVQLHTSQNCIVESLFHHIAITSIHIQFQHTGSEEDQTDGSAGFCISGIIWQMIIGGKSFSDSG